jgi:hypothetical protein
MAQSRRMPVRLRSGLVKRSTSARASVCFCSASVARWLASLVERCASAALVLCMSIWALAVFSASAKRSISAIWRAPSSRW